MARFAGFLAASAFGSAFVFTVLTFSPTAHAKDFARDADWLSLTWYVGAGTSWVDLDERALSPVLADSGDVMLNMTSITFGLQTQISKKWIVGLEGYAHMGRNALQSYEVDARSFHTLGRLGYIVYRGDSGVLYPTLGLGVGGASILVSELSEDRVRLPTGVLDLGLRGDYTVKVLENERKRTFVQVGISGGLMLAPVSRSSVVDGFYLRFIFGGSKAKREIWNP